MTLRELVLDAIRDAVADGWSLTAIANAAGVAPITVSRFNRGLADLTLDTAEKILGALGCRAEIRGVGR